MPDQKSIIWVAVVDDHNLFRKGLIKLISLGVNADRYRVLFEAENGRMMKEKLNKHSLPDIILMDIDMPDMDGYETVAWLKKFYPDVDILVISMFESEETILRMLRLGVNGYISKDIEIEDLAVALEAIEKKGFYYSDVVASAMARNIHSGVKGKKEQAPIADMSENELEFMRLACTEMTYQEIAYKMNLSPKTIDGYREALFGKFKVKTRVSLAMYAVKNGLVKL